MGLLSDLFSVAQELQGLRDDVSSTVEKVVSDATGIKDDVEQSVLDAKQGIIDNTNRSVTEEN